MEFRPVNGLKQLADSSPFYIPDRIRSLRRITEFSPEELWKRLDSAVARDNGNLVLYIHGYNLSFQKACRRAATFQRELDLHGRLLLFSWPANGNLLTYTQDEADISWSVDYLENFLASLHLRYGAERVSLVGHSLGARGLVEALMHLGYGNAGRPLFNELVLIAPDIDSQVFIKRLAELRPQVKRITLYASAHDKALKFSNEVHGAARLGEAGERLTLAPGIETIDVSALETRSVSGHIYHQHDSSVIADIKQLLDAGKGAAGRSGLTQRSRQDGDYWVLQP
jgi:esterase/lipase superfamily enzyme